ncbi:hypothetical protein EBV26_20965, partial [bacterium]|nr:hypothetical protein [bacterium]
MFEKKKIVRLLSNLIINLIIINRKDIISKLCNPQSSPSQSAEQPLLSKQGLFVNAERVNEELIDMYKSIGEGKMKPGLRIELKKKQVDITPLIFVEEWDVSLNL